MYLQPQKNEGQWVNDAHEGQGEEVWADWAKYAEIILMGWSMVTVSGKECTAIATVASGPKWQM